MNRKETTKVLQDQVDKLTNVTYSQLSEMAVQNRVSEIEVSAESGTRYYVMIQILKDMMEQPAIDVMISVTDGRFFSFCPIMAHMVIYPDGSTQRLPVNKRNRPEITSGGQL